MAQSWFADPELLHTSFSVSYVCNNLSKAGDTLVRRSHVPKRSTNPCFPLLERPERPNSLELDALAL